MLAESVTVPVVKLDPVVRQAFDDVLEHLGVKTVGVRAGSELVVRIVDKSRALPRDFRKSLLDALDKEPRWTSKFTSVTYI